MAPLVYAGIGARKTPEPVLAVMRRMAWYLVEKGTGGADGADTAFVEGSPALCTVFLPWEGYNGWTGAECVTLGEKAIAKLQPFAAAHHDAWERCSPRVRKLHARNVAVIGGAGITEPVSAVVCWTMRGRVTGGTGLAIRLAETAGIPVFNLASVHPRDVCLAMRRVPRDEPHRPGGACATAVERASLPPAERCTPSHRARPSRDRGQRGARPRTVNPRTARVLRFAPAAGAVTALRARTPSAPVRRRAPPPRTAPCTAPPSSTSSTTRS